MSSQVISCFKCRADDKIEYFILVRGLAENHINALFFDEGLKAHPEVDGKHRELGHQQRAVGAFDCLLSLDFKV